MGDTNMKSLRHVTVWLVALTGVVAAMLTLLIVPIVALPESNLQLTTGFSSLQLLSLAAISAWAVFVLALIVHLFVLNHALNDTESLLEVARARLLQPLDESHTIRKPGADNAASQSPPKSPTTTESPV